MAINLNKTRYQGRKSQRMSSLSQATSVNLNTLDEMRSFNVGDRFLHQLLTVYRYWPMLEPIEIFSLSDMTEQPCDT